MCFNNSEKQALKLTEADRRHRREGWGRGEGERRNGGSERETRRREKG